MSALVSVIVPVYNGAAYIAQAVDSALAQDHPEKEIIVVNDGSSDGTLALLKTYGSRIRLIDQPNGGPQRARNAGLGAAQGDYIAFLDADDVWLQGKLAAQVAHLQAHPEVGTCYFQWHVWRADADGQFRVPAFALQPLQRVVCNDAMSGWIYGRLLFECEMLTTTVMVRAGLARQIGEFDTRLWNGDDYDYWLRLSQAAPISRLEPAAALYRVVSGSVSRRARPVNDELVVVQGAAARHGLTDPVGNRVDAKRLRRHLDALRFQHAYSHLQMGDSVVARQEFAACIRRQPWRWRLWVNWLRAVAAR